MAYEMKWVPRGVYKMFSGAIAGHEFIRSANAVGESEHFERLHFVVNDFTAATSFSLNAAELTEYAAINVGSMSTNADIWVAFVGVHRALHEITAALRHGPLSGGHHVGMFESLAAAEHWLATPRSMRHYLRGLHLRKEA